jgi:hypothetical protein
LSNLVVGSDFERQYFDTIKHSFVVDKKFLTVPDVVAVFGLIFWVLAASWVTAGDEVGDAGSNTRAGVPEDFSWATVVHWAGPDGENDVLTW